MIAAVSGLRHAPHDQVPFDAVLDDLCHRVIFGLVSLAWQSCKVLNFLNVRADQSEHL
jgi:hypothetical protein